MARTDRKKGTSSSAGATEVERKNSVSRAKLVVITGLSGSGKITALKVFEDMGYYCVDNLPAELIPSFAQLIQVFPLCRHGASSFQVQEPRTLRGGSGVCVGAFSCGCGWDAVDAFEGAAEGGF